MSVQAQALGLNAVVGHIMNSDFSDSHWSAFINLLVLMAALSLCGLFLLAQPAHAGFAF